jgi:hypothetical protein
MVTPATGAVMDIESPQEREHSLRRAAYLTVGVGIAHALLFLLAFWLLFSVPRGSAAEEITDVYRRRLTLSGLYLMPFAGIAFMWFIIALRMWISGHRHPENVLTSTMQLFSGMMYVALIFVACGAAAAVAATTEFAGRPVVQPIASQFHEFGRAILFIFAVRMAAMFVLCTTNIGRGTGILPRWFVYAGYAAGLFMLLSASFNHVLIVVFPVWLLVLCAFLLRRARQFPPGAPLPQPGAPTATVTAGRGEIAP